MEHKTPDAVSQKISPLEIKNKEFKKTMWGYAPQEVVEFLDLTAKAWEGVQRHEKELVDKIKYLGEELTRWKNRELEIVKLKEKAQHDADQIRQQAQSDAQRAFVEIEDRASTIRQKTEEWLADVISQVEETERQKMNFMTAFKSALDSHYQLLRTEQEEAEPLGARLSHFLKMATSAAGNSGN